MSTIDFSIDETDPEVTALCGQTSVLKVHRILQHYLETCENDPKSFSNALTQLDAMLHSIDPKDEGKEGSASTEHTAFSWTLIDLALKVPYSHPAQDHLVSLLAHLRKSVKLNKAVLDTDTDRQAYASLTYFHRSVYEKCANFLFEPGTSEEVASLNECAFLARLSAAGISPDIIYAIWNFRELLEEEAAYKHNAALYSASMAGASVWIIYAGQSLFKEVVHSPRASSLNETSWRTGTLYDGPILGFPRWSFWRKTLDAARESPRVGDDTRVLTQKAVELMDVLERANK
ncbi:hypothetical protein ASPZODRAFT_163556 [Penicilliopsis zonata CBS 506.65]|uniref:Uncharacterized protein n=1 Tax=Penicilliopsis zonata CBS 506.65 TaxID=1073090 RepID=A0A1L9SXG1_9EURO|nr:hypothetical protein ASPZODRAFT_163556 [Penicilliopsis zonata CBS 506.65]OJJ51771.1 hypothetical protein ASPZODRAFT_163556 [Penicilliopsis zonata CBS 506.65]